MSQRDDLLTQLREARPPAPAELRERVRRIAAEAAPEPRHGIRWRRVFVVAAPIAAAVAGAAILLPRGHQQAASRQPSHHSCSGREERRSSTSAYSATARRGRSGRPPRSGPGPRPADHHDARLRLPNTQAVSDATKQAVAITRSLGGYPKALNVDAEGRTGYASLVLRIPKQNVQRAVSRLSELGTIVGENVQIQDIQAQVDAASPQDRAPAGTPRLLAGPAATDEAAQHVAALTTQIAKLRTRPGEHDQDRELRHGLGSDDDEARRRCRRTRARAAAQPRRGVSLDRDRRRLRARARRAASSSSELSSGSPPAPSAGTARTSCSARP